MTIYGSQIDFSVPETIPYGEFLDAFDTAIEAIDADSGFYSADAHVNKRDGAILVGVNVPEGVESDVYFSEKMTSIVLPALISAGILAESIVLVPSPEFAYA